MASQVADEVAQVMANCGSNAEYVKELCFQCSGAFNLADTDGSGYLSRQELTALLARVNSPLEPEKTFKFCDLDRNNQVTKLEFIKAIVCICMEDDIRRVFKDFDEDGSGQIDRDELGKLASSCKEKGIDQGRLQRVLAKYDDDCSGSISFEEFRDHFFACH
ncbi:uncharacterized protein LOC135500115 [Lineus longissimus]|uniref:uncharacterized protein LOC135500115 n=1 Tax=Lineus longissimus TaxID=88925 RepID=UPI002B4F9630